MISQINTLTIMCGFLPSGLYCVPKRYMMVLLGFLLTLISSLMKYSIGIAMTEMVVPHAAIHHIRTGNEYDCPFVRNGTINPSTDPQLFHSQTAELFDWSEKTQGLIFGSLYWTYMPLQIPMGVAVERLGVRHVLAGGMLLASLCYLLTPVAVVHFGAVGFIVTRLVMGVGLAPAYPSLNIILAKWAPPKEKSKLAAIIYAGENLGFIFSMAVSGLILGSAKGNWPVLFYVYGGVSVAWLILWIFFGYNDPVSHPFCSAAERIYLEDCLPHNINKEELPPTPWREMAKSVPLWGILVAQIGHDWGIITIVNELPRYMKQVLHYEIEANGLLNAIPYIAMTVVAVVSGWLSDWILYRNLMSITSVRKVFNSISAAGPALGIVAAMHAGCDSAMVVLMFTLGMALMGFFYSSLAVNPLDLSPNYSGTLMGVMAYGGLGGIVSPYLAGALTPEGTMEQWRGVFWVTVCVLMVTNTFYLVTGSGEVQAWNRPGDSHTKPAEQRKEDPHNWSQNNYKV